MKSKIKPIIAWVVVDKKKPTISTYDIYRTKDGLIIDKDEMIIKVKIEAV